MPIEILANDVRSSTMTTTYITLELCAVLHFTVYLVAEYVILKWSNDKRY